MSAEQDIEAALLIARARRNAMMGRSRTPFITTATTAFLRTIDVLSMHVPGTEETRKWLNAARLSTMKRGAIVANTGRGPSVDDEALIAALKSGHIRAAGLDDFDGEPNVNPGYLTLENVTLLQHLGSATIETRDAMGHCALDDVDAVLLKETDPVHRVT
jgi:lactate dehydrogenase-like 2-hydroxyacid dehydrogenase